VVIAIIAVLGALSFALFGRGRDAARSASCVNNIKQVCSTHLALAQENGGFIVHPYRSIVQNGWNRNWAQFHTILLSEDFNWRQPGADVNIRMRTLDQFQCPTAYAEKQSKMRELDGHDGWRTYMLNGRIGTDKEPSSEDRGWIDGARTVIEVVSPARLVLVSERVWNGSKYPPAGGPWPGEFGYADFHSGGFHVGYFDGHVQRHTPDNFLLGGVTLPNGQEGKWSNREFSLMWRGRMSPRQIDN